MRDPKTRALSQFKVWARKCRDNGVLEQAISEVVADIHNADIHADIPKKKEGGKKAPPTPPIKKGGSKKKTTTTTTARACEETFPPTLETVDAFAATLGIPHDFAKTWFDTQQNVNHWFHPKSGLPLTGWRSSLRMWWKRRGEFDPLPEASPANAKEETFESLKGLVG